MDLKAIGRRIKAAREVKGLTQEALAELVNFKPHAYLETAGFKLAHLWGFLWGNAFFPEVVPGYTPDTLSQPGTSKWRVWILVFP